MKKCLFLGAMAAMLLGTASCSSDIEPVAGDEALVTFTVNLGDGIDSRTISDGTGANTLYFSVYTADGQHLDLDQEVTVVNKMATVQTRLARYHNYKLVFWAQNSECSAYTFNRATGAITVDYENVNCNDETRDAFYKMEEVNVDNADVNRLVVLTRPFAQINFVAGDVDGIANIDDYTCDVTVTDVPNTLNGLDGSVGTETTDVTFKRATILANETLEGYESYRYVAMNYILAAPEKELKNKVTLNVYENAEDETPVNTVAVESCPVQRNYRTNIFGNLFTLEGKFNVDIDPGYIGDHYVYVESIGNMPLDDALHLDAENIYIIIPAGTYIYQTSAYNSIPGGTYGGPNTKSITIVGNNGSSSTNMTATTLIGTTTYWSYFTTTNPDCVVTFKNMTVTSQGNSVGTWDGYDYAIDCGDFNAENVKFLKPVSLCNPGYKNVFKNVTIEATNTPSDAYAMWMETGTDVTLNGCTVNAVSTNGMSNRGIKISDQYIDGDAATAMSYLNIKNSTFKSNTKAAVLVGSKGGATITVDGIDISGVAADQTNAVWVDDDYLDYANLVTVTGATVINEP